LPTTAGWSPKARGEGKIATCCENFGTAVAVLSRRPNGLGISGISGVSGLGSGLGGLGSAAQLESAAAVLLVLSLNYGLYSFEQKVVQRFSFGFSGAVKREGEGEGERGKRGHSKQSAEREGSGSGSDSPSRPSSPPSTPRAAATYASLEFQPCY